MCAARAVGDSDPPPPLPLPSCWFHARAVWDLDRRRPHSRTLSSIRGAILTSSLCSWIKRMRSDWETSSNSLASVTLDPSSKAGSQSYTPTLWLQASGCVGESGRLVMGWKNAPQIRARIEALLYPR